MADHRWTSSAGQVVVSNNSSASASSRDLCHCVALLRLSDDVIAYMLLSFLSPFGGQVHSAIDILRAQRSRFPALGSEEYEAFASSHFQRHHFSFSEKTVRDWVSQSIPLSHVCRRFYFLIREALEFDAALWQVAMLYWTPLLSTSNIPVQQYEQEAVNRWICPRGQYCPLQQCLRVHPSSLSVQVTRLVQRYYEHTFSCSHEFISFANHREELFGTAVLEQLQLYSVLQRFPELALLSLQRTLRMKLHLFFVQNIKFPFLLYALTMIGILTCSSLLCFSVSFFLRKRDAIAFDACFDVLKLGYLLALSSSILMCLLSFVFLLYSILLDPFFAYLLRQRHIVYTTGVYSASMLVSLVIAFTQPDASQLHVWSPIILALFINFCFLRPSESSEGKSVDELELDFVVFLTCIFSFVLAPTCIDSEKHISTAFAPVLLPELAWLAVRSLRFKREIMATRTVALLGAPKEDILATTHSRTRSFLHVLLPVNLLFFEACACYLNSLQGAAAAALPFVLTAVALFGFSFLGHESHWKYLQ